MRGQALVELSFGALVLVTMLLFAVYLSELGFMRLQLQEAAHAAQWRLTAVEVGAQPDARTRQALERAAAEVSARYRDLDGRRSGARSGRWLFAVPGDAQVRCEVGIGFSQPAVDALAEVYRDLGGVRCQASADVRVVGLPQAFAEGAAGFFGAPHLARPLRHVSSSAVALAVGDWGLHGEGQAGSLSQGVLDGRVGAEQNPELYRRVAVAFEKSSAGVTRGAATALQRFAGGPYLSEDALYLAVGGEADAHPLQQAVNGPAQQHPHLDNAQALAPTAPGSAWPLSPDEPPERYRRAWAGLRQERFLGGGRR